MSTTQTYANHTRWHPPFHFFVIPVMVVNFFWAVVVFAKAPDRNSGWWIVVSVALLMMAFFTRTNALRVQDRLIRLEEKVRFQRVLSPTLQSQCSVLTPAQIVALRFAPDDELEDLVSQVIAGKFIRTGDIKQAIKNWRSDTFRV